jgi:hypothetical protein
MVDRACGYDRVPLIPALMLTICPALPQIHTLAFRKQTVLSIVGLCQV